MVVCLSTERFRIPCGQLVQKLFSDVAEAFHLCNRKLPCHQTPTAFHQDDITNLNLPIGRTANFAPAAFYRLPAVENKVKEWWGENGHVCSRHDVWRPVRLRTHTMRFLHWVLSPNLHPVTAAVH